MAEEKVKKKRSRIAVILWSFTAVVVMLIGILAILFFGFPDVLEDPNLKLVKEAGELIIGLGEQGKAELEKLIEQETSTADSRGKTPKRGKLTFQGERSHQVQAGESLWGIAKMGELVDNQWEWRTILMQNSDKIDYAFISAEDVSDGNGAWKVMLPVGQELVVNQPDLPELRGKMEGKKWLIQFAAVKEARVNKGVSVVRAMMREGYYANLERFELDGQVWYRIRSGFYDSKNDASNTAEEIHEQFFEEFLGTPRVFRASEAEKSGDGMVFGAQLANPWAIEFARRDSHREALRDLRKVKGGENLAYIWQTADGPGGSYAYQVRIGFFDSENAANAMSTGKKAGIWGDARSIRIDSLVETLPGQPHQLGQISF